MRLTLLSLIFMAFSAGAGAQPVNLEAHDPAELKTSVIESSVLPCEYDEAYTGLAVSSTIIGIYFLYWFRNRSSRN